MKRRVEYRVATVDGRKFLKHVGFGAFEWSTSVIGSHRFKHLEEALEAAEFYGGIVYDTYGKRVET